MEHWTAARSSGPTDQPGTICIEISGGPFNGDPNIERVRATVIARVDDPQNEDQRLEKGLIRLIEILQHKLRVLQGVN